MKQYAKLIIKALFRPPKSHCPRGLLLCFMQSPLIFSSALVNYMLTVPVPDFFQF